MLFPIHETSRVYRSSIDIQERYDWVFAIEPGVDSYTETFHSIQVTKPLSSVLFDSGIGLSHSSILCALECHVTLIPDSLSANTLLTLNYDCLASG